MNSNKQNTKSNAQRNSYMQSHLDRFLNGLQINNKESIQKAILDLLILDATSKDSSDVALVGTTINEILQSTKIFQDYRHIKKACIFGSARTKPDHPNYKMTVELSKKLNNINFMTITGAGPGIMQAGNEGAGKENSFGLNILLPFEQNSNPYIHGDPKLIDYKYFYTRKLAFIKESHASIIFPGGFGTHDEGFEVLTLIQTGRCAPRPIILIAHSESDYWEKWEEYVKVQLSDRHYISPEDHDMFHVIHDTDEAIEKIQEFYKHYDSLRYIGNTCVMRINKPLKESTLKTLKETFKTITMDSDFTQGDASIVAEDADTHDDKYRLIFPFDKVNYARLYAVIAKINSCEE